MPVLLRCLKDIPESGAYDFWFAAAGQGAGLPEGKKLPDLGRRLEDTFNEICPEWLQVGKSLADGPGAELAYATTCAGYGSDFGQMMAWGRLTESSAREKETTLVVCDDPWLFRHLASLPGVEARTLPALWPAAVKLQLRGVLARLRLIGRLFRAALATRRQRRAHGKGDAVILVYGHPASTAEGYDDYFDEMMTKLPGLKRALHTDCGPGQAARLATDGRTASLHAWGNPFSALGLLFVRWRPNPEHLKGPFGWLVRRAAETEASGAAHAMNAWQRQCQEAWLATMSPTVVAWPWENHGWERAFCRVARRLGVSTLGSQHTVIGPHQQNQSPATNVDGEASLPDTLVCDGPAYRDQLADWGIAPGRMVIGGSLRIGRPEDGVYDPDAPCFVALSAQRSIARQQLQAVEAAARKGFHFLVKEHPMYPFDVPETDRIRRARDRLTKQTALSAVLYSTGTSGLEALLSGLPTFRLRPEDQVAVDVLPDFLSAIPIAVDGLAHALETAKPPPTTKWESILSPVDWDLWRKLLEPIKRDKAA